MRFVLVALALPALVAAAALAQDAANAAADRQAAMKQLGRNLGVIKAYFEDRTDHARAVEAAQTLVARMKAAPALFAPGTSTKELPGKTAAKPEIWTEQEKFGDAYRHALAEIEKLQATVAGGDKKAIREQFAKAGQSGCEGCHDKFRDKI